MRSSNLPSGEVTLTLSIKILSVIYFLGVSVWFCLIGPNFFDACLSWTGMLCWGYEVKRFREFIEGYPVIGLARGTWFLRSDQAGLTDNIFVSLRLNSVIIPGLLLLSFQDARKKSYSFLVVPSMVGGREKFSWLARYANLTPIFQ